jgi:cephalosporin-C deacetylase-like acetyl esterase
MMMQHRLGDENMKIQSGVKTILWMVGLVLSMHSAAVSQYNQEQPNQIRAYLSSAAREITQKSLQDIQTLGDWQRARSSRYDQLVEMLSLTDVPLREERPAPKVTITGTIQQDGFKIVKLYYESLPDLYVPANLYIPDHLTGPAPAVLYVCGHSRTQKVHYQTHPRKWAQLGFVCLIIETIQWGEVQGDHWGCYARGWFHWYSRGYTPGGMEAWNAIRGLDLLCDRDEVDPERLGVTGISGGGSQSFYIGAIDPRVKVSAPACGGCTLESQVGQRVLDGHCDCMMPINTYGIDFSDIGALIAPRALLVAQADRDGLNPIESVREMSQKIERIYDLHQAKNHYEFVETPGPHSYHEQSRTRIFSFFMKHLMKKEVSPEDIGDIDENPETLLSEEQLRVYVDGPPRNDRTRSIQDSFQVMAAAPHIRSSQDMAAYRENILSFLTQKTFRAFPPRDASSLNIRKEFRAHSKNGGEVLYSFVPEPGYRLQVDCQWPEEQTEKKPVLLVLRSPDEKRWESEGFASGLTGEWNRAYLEVRGIGETGWSQNLQWHIRRAAAWTGRTVASMRVYDVLRCLQTLRSLPNVDGDKIAVAARDEMAAIALYAALLDQQVHTLLLKNPPATQDVPSQEDGRGQAIEMLNCLRVTDLPYIAGVLSPTSVVFLGQPHGNYAWASEVNAAIGQAEKIRQVNSIRDWKP